MHFFHAPSGFISSDGEDDEMIAVRIVKRLYEHSSGHGMKFPMRGETRAIIFEDNEILANRRAQRRHDRSPCDSSLKSNSESSFRAHLKWL